MNKVMALIAVVFGIVLAGCQTTTTPKPERTAAESEASLQITKLFRCTDVYLDGLRNFSQTASLGQRMEKVVRGFETLCSITPRNPEEANSLQGRLTQHSRGARYKLVSRTYRSSNLDEKVHMQESFYCANKNARQQHKLQTEKRIALMFANASEAQSIEKASQRLQRKWDQVCAIPRNTQRGKRRFIRNIPALWEIHRNYSKALIATSAFAT